MLGSTVSAKLSFIGPELSAIPETKIAEIAKKENIQFIVFLALSQIIKRRIDLNSTIEMLLVLIPLKICLLQLKFAN
mgnify:CR=1 FL=1